ncbi:MAG TPA: RNA methyltransferase [Burkholderiaceae bacterium]|nr:RNA methyltransferase [Burkholderiaceae bacterium]
MPVIPVASTADPLLADYALLREPARLRARGAFVAEGRFVVRRLVEGERFAVRSLLVTETAHAALADLAPRLVAVPVLVGSKALAREVTGFSFHQGCLAIGERGAEERDVARWLEALGPGARTIVALENVSHADNVGAVFRNAAAFGADGVLLDGGTADPLYREAVRVSMAATLRVPFARPSRLAEAIGTLAEAGFRVAALTPRPSAIELGELGARVARDHRLAFLVGSEGEGLSDAALALADLELRIPMAEGVDSLNLAAATAIALYERSRR